MSLRKINDYPAPNLEDWNQVCKSIQHRPSQDMHHLTPGTYKWTCPTCKNFMLFKVTERVTF